MPNAAIGKRIRDTRRDRGLTQEGLARLLPGDITRGAVGNWELGKGISGSNLLAVAEALRVDYGWLASGKREHALTPPFDVRETHLTLAALKIRGTVEAGVWREPQMYNPEDLYDAPSAFVLPDQSIPEQSQYLLEVRGDSMDAATPTPIRHGALLKVVDVYAWPGKPKSQMIVIVHRTRDGGTLIETTVKRLELLQDRMILRPESTNLAHQPITVPIDGNADDGTEVKIVGIVTGVIYDLKY